MAPNFSKYLTKNNAYAAAGVAVALWILSSRQNAKLRKIER